MASFNKVVLVGNLTADPELRTLASGMSVCELRMAVNEKYKNKDGEWVDTPVFVSVEVWDKQAENCNQYLFKGSPLLVEGKLKFDQWEDKEGQKRSKLSIRGMAVQFLGTKSDQAESQPRCATPDPAKSAVEGDEEDDLPF